MSTKSTNYADVVKQLASGRRSERENKQLADSQAQESFKLLCAEVLGVCLTAFRQAHRAGILYRSTDRGVQIDPRPCLDRHTNYMQMEVGSSLCFHTAPNILVGLRVVSQFGSLKVALDRRNGRFVTLAIGEPEEVLPQLLEQMAISADFAQLCAE